MSSLTDPDHLKSVLRKGHEAQARRRCSSATSVIVPDEYPTFTRDTKRKRSHPWYKRDSSSESGDDCDHPLVSTPSRKASIILSPFKSQRTCSHVGGGIADDSAESSSKNSPPRVARRMGLTERRRSSLQKLKELVRSKRKDSGQAEEMPSPHTSDQSYGSHSLSRDASPQRSPSSFIAPDAEMFYMTGALEPDTYHLRSRSDVSVDGISPSGRTQHTGRRASNPSSSRSSYASIRVNEDPLAPSPDINTKAGVQDDPHRWQKLNGYSPPPTPRDSRSQGNLFNRLPNFRDTNALRQFAKRDPLRSMPPSTATRHVARSSHDAPAFPPAPGFPSDSPPCSARPSPRPENLDELGVIPPRPSVESMEDIAVPTFTPILNTANASPVASPAPSFPHSRTPSPSCVLDPSFPPSLSSNPTGFELPSESPFALPPLYMGLSASVVFQPEISDLAWPAGLFGTPEPAGSRERPSTMETALDDASLHEGLDLRRLAASVEGENEYETWAETGYQRGNDMPYFDTDALAGLEGLEGYMFAERAMRWTDDEYCTTPPRGRARW